MNVYGGGQTSPKFRFFSSTTVVPRRASVIFMAKVKGVVLKHFLGGEVPKPSLLLTCRLPTAKCDCYVQHAATCVEENKHSEGGLKFRETTLIYLPSYNNRETVKE